MDPTEEIERLIREMEADSMPDTFQAVLEEILGEAPNAPPPPPQAEQWFNIHPQPVGSVSGGYGGCLQLDTDPHSFQAESVGRTALTDDFDRLVNLMEWDEVLGTVQAVMGEALGDIPNPPPAPPGAAAFSAPPQQYNNLQVVDLPQGLEENLVPVGAMTREPVYEIPAERFAPFSLLLPAAPPVNTSVSKKRQCEGQQDEDRPYIKKPPNAFMVFRKEQRPNVVAELNISESATVNTILGQRWNLLSKDEKEKYFQEAEKERRLHAQQFPDWSPSDNYGRKRKRNRSKAPKAAAPASTPEVTQPAKKQCVTPVQTAVMEPSTSQMGAIGAPHTQTGGMVAPAPLTVLLLENPHTQTVMDSSTVRTVWVKLPQQDTPVNVPVCVTCDLPNVDGLFSIQSPGAWSTLQPR